MPAPVVYGGLGLKGAGLGLMGLGGLQQAQAYTPTVAMPKTALPYIAHLYTNTWQFKRTLGGARLVAGQTAGGIVTKPSLKMTINGGYQPVTLELDAEQPPANLVVDPGFEASDVLADVQTNWTLTTPGEWALMTTPADLHSGRRAMKCTRTNLGPNNWNTMRTPTAQRFAVIAGQTYALSLFVRTNGGVVQSHAKVNWKDSAGNAISSTFTGTLTGANAWRLLTVSGVAPSNAALGEIELLAGWWDGVTGTDAQTWFDDARLVLGTDKSDPAVNGDLVQLTEQGDASGVVLYTGIIEQITDVISEEGADAHELILTPLVAELADAYFNQQYVALTDVAQMVRDAVAQTAHLRVAPYSVGDSGVTALYNFNTTNALDVLNVAKTIAGPTWFWFVDAVGLVWFQPAPTSVPADVVLKGRIDYTKYRRTRGIGGLKNHVVALGGQQIPTPSGPQTAPITSTYDNPASRKKNGMRNFDPPLVFPTVTDQTTLDKIVNTIGVSVDREENSIEVLLPAYKSRLSLGSPGGLTVKLREPALDAYPQPGTRGTVGDIGPYVVQGIEVDGPKQRLVLGDLPLTGLKDIQYVIDRIIQRSSMNPVTLPPVAGTLAFLRTATGVVHVDQLGLISSAVLSVLAGPLFPPDTSVTSGSKFMPGTNIQFTLQRTTRLLVIYGCAGKSTTTSGTSFVYVDGSVQPPDEPTGLNMSGLLWDVATVNTNGLGIMIVNLPAGQHTLDVVLNNASGTTSVTGMFVAVFQLGS